MESRDELETLVHARWCVEVYHREIKQTCGIERCQSCTTRAQINHIFLSILAWFEQHKIRLTKRMTFC
ncbi:transposase [Gammaproteobacteria bacterium]|nr:transposase [Gammaproteobacteria bacterium]